jgi:hypothetical protein
MLSEQGRELETSIKKTSVTTFCNLTCSATQEKLK